jgi:hypothetical protein
MIGITGSSGYLGGKIVRSVAAQRAAKQPLIAMTRRPEKAPDLEPIRWDLKDPQRQTLWSAPAPRSWFEEGSCFRGAELRASLKSTPIVALQV